MGRIASSTLPMLMLGLRRDGFHGSLRLSRGPARRDLQFVAGRLTRVESTLPADALAPVLESLGSLDADARQRVADAVTAGTPELRAIASLRTVTPKDLLAGVAEQARRAARDSLDWAEGDFSLEPARPDASPACAPQGALDVVPIVLDAIARRFEPHQVLELLDDRATHFPTPAEDQSPLPDHPWIEGLLPALDGATAPFNLLRGPAPAERAAALLVLDACGQLTWCAEPTQTGPAPEEAQGEPGEAQPPPPAEPELEIEVVGAETTTETVAANGEAPEDGRRSEKVEQLVAEVLELHGRLREIDHYTLLGVEPDAKPAAIRRAYLKLAKRLHPDSVARVGATEIREQANAVFAQIGEAHEILCDADDRAHYDASLRGEDDVDMQKVAQAEALFQKGEMLMRAGNFLGAVEFLEPAVGLYPVEADYQGALGWCLYRKTPPEADRAREHLSEALRLAPDVAIWPFRMHYVLRELGDEAGARESLQAARRIDPEIS